MPTYELYNKKTKKVEELWLSISEYREFMLDNPHMERYFDTAPGFTMDGKSFLDQPSKLGGFKEVLQKIGENHRDSEVDKRFRTPRDTKRVKTDIAVGKALNKRKDFEAQKARRDKW